MCIHMYVYMYIYHMYLYGRLTLHLFHLCDYFKKQIWLHFATRKNCKETLSTIMDKTSKISRFNEGTQMQIKITLILKLFFYSLSKFSNIRFLIYSFCSVKVLKIFQNVIAS